MTPAEIERVFGRGRLKMVTGEHVEVYREAVAPGERRRYTKRFLETREGDFGQWTEREWRILARLIGHGVTCVPDVVQYDRGRRGSVQLVQTYDAGVTVDQWATLLPVTRDHHVHRHVFEDCAHWWALAHHALRALDAIHALELVHLDVKGDNVCIPYAPASLDPDAADPQLRPVFAQLALIDFAFSLVSGESLQTPLPIGWQKDYDYQSPRLLAALDAGRAGDLGPTRELDWRCDMYSLAAMLKRYLPDTHAAAVAGWTTTHHDAARALILRIRDAHDRAPEARRPHAALVAETAARLAEGDLAQSLERGWTLAREATIAPASPSPLTPVTRIAPPMNVLRSGRTAVTVLARTKVTALAPDAPARQMNATPRRTSRPAMLITLGALVAIAVALPFVADRLLPGAADDPALAAMESVPDEPGGEPGRGVRKASPSGDATAVAGEAPPTASAAPTRAAPPSPPPPSDVRPDAAAQATTIAPPAAVAPSPMSEAAPPSLARSMAPPAASANAPAKPSSDTGRAAGKATRGATSVAINAAKPADTPSQSPAPRRVLPSWVSLQPPSWLRSGTPPLPPGMKTPEASSTVVAAADGAKTDAARATTTPAATTSAGLDAPRAETPLSPSAAPAPTATQPAAREPRNTAPTPRMWSRAGSAPIDEHSPPLAPALAEPRAAPRQAQSQAPSPVQPSLPLLERTAADDFGMQGRRMLSDTVPRVAVEAEREVNRVLWLAAGANHPAQDAMIADAARATRVAGDSMLGTGASAPAEARRLNDEARSAIAERRVREALDLQMRAFGANPRDPEVAGNLALLYLRLSPPQPDTARQVALFALAARGAQFHSTRMEDWNTFAVASALAGREPDATRALYVTLALSANVESRCASALSALASYGERLRGPVEAMLYRVRTQGRAVDAPACAWPATWTVRRLP